MHTINIRYTHTHIIKIYNKELHLQFTNTYSYFRVRITCNKGV